MRFDRRLEIFSVVLVTALAIVLTRPVTWALLTGQFVAHWTCEEDSLLIDLAIRMHDFFTHH